MKKIITLIAIVFCLNGSAQTCGAAQTLTTTQQSQISAILSPLDTVLKYENLGKIDSLNVVLKTIYGAQAGIPDAAETYFTLTPTTTWLNLSNALLLSRHLIAADSMDYVNLWKMAKGENPPAYQPHSIFLRTSAQYAVGLLKIAAKETDVTRKAAYQLWAKSALDSLATMQLPSGAFPFPDLRTYGDPLYTTIIQSFLNWCGADSVNVLHNGWIIDDKGTGSFDFDAGVIANAYFEAYNYTGNMAYKNIAVSIGNYLKPIHFNNNYNYNTFVSVGLTRAYQLTNDTSFLNRGIKTIRYSVLPGQIANGRWVDGHNANSRYHSIIIQNVVPTVELLVSTANYADTINNMTYKAVKNLVDYTYACQSTTAFQWAIKAYGLNTSVIPQTLKDSVTNLIGQYMNQAAIDGKYLDAPTMGDYIELLGTTTGIKKITDYTELIRIYPNPSKGNFAIEVNDATKQTIQVYDVNGKMVLSQSLTPTLRQAQGAQETFTIDASSLNEGVYNISIISNEGVVNKRLVIVK